MFTVQNLFVHCLELTEGLQGVLPFYPLCKIYTVPVYRMLCTLFGSHYMVHTGAHYIVHTGAHYIGHTASSQVSCVCTLQSAQCTDLSGGCCGVEGEEGKVRC